MFSLLKQRRLGRAQDLPSSNVSSSSPGLQSFDKLCSNCSRIILCVREAPNTYRDVDNYLIIEDKVMEEISGLALAQVTERILRQNASEGCRFCAMRIENSGTDNFETLGNSFYISMSYSHIKDVRAPGESFLSNWNCTQAYSTKTGDFVPSVTEVDPAASLITRRPPLINFSSQKAFAQIWRWIDECTQNHGSLCPKETPRPLPTRLVDVGTSNSEPSLLCPPPGQLGKYVALSYCWGSRPQKVLTNSQAKLNRVVFSLSSLSATVRDAVIICRYLKIKFLWVDALCIIQDSPNAEDWTRESAVMDQIYRNAFITLAAAGAPNVSEGILAAASEPSSGSCSIPLNMYDRSRPLAVDEKWNGNARLSQIDGSTAKLRFYPYDIDDKQPLAKRAWAFQEYAMSNRILSYQKEQLVWECKTGKQYMDGPVNVEQLQTNRTWEQCIEQYTQRNLTFPDDRLIAISGYAKLKYRENQLGGGTSTLKRYLAGLWEVDLVDHMLWISKIKPPPPRPTFYRAPTWSWASIDGPIEYVSDERKGHKDFTIKLVSVSLSTNPLNPFGTLLQSPPSFLHLKGFLKAAPGIEIPSKDAPLPLHKKFRQTLARSWWIEFDIIDVKERMTEAAIDSIEEDNPLSGQNTLYCLRLTEFTALILLPIGRKDRAPAFERVGTVRHWHRAEWKWFDDVEQMTELYLF